MKKLTVEKLLNMARQGVVVRIAHFWQEEDGTERDYDILIIEMVAIRGDELLYLYYRNPPLPSDSTGAPTIEIHEPKGWQKAAGCIIGDWGATSFQSWKTDFPLAVVIQPEPHATTEFVESFLHIFSYLRLIEGVLSVMAPRNHEHRHTPATCLLNRIRGLRRAYEVSLIRQTDRWSRESEKMLTHHSIPRNSL